MKDSKSVANAMSNETAQKIISYLAEHKEATESEISEKLKVPLPTVHYNIQQLKKAKLIDAKEFFWSKKGKEMLVYRLAKKYIIISPDNSESSLTNLKTLLPVTLLSLIGTGAIYLWQKTKLTGSFMMEKATETVTSENTGKFISDASEQIAMPIKDGTVGKMTVGGDQVANLTQEVVTQVIPPNYALFFLIGSLSVILFILLLSLFRRK